MSNRVTRAVDYAAHYIGYGIDLVPKGAYATAVLLLLLAYAVHDYQVREYSSRVQEVQYDKKELKKLEGKETESQQSSGRNGC